MNVLIVEDERGLAREIENFLSKERFLCDIAFNAKQATEKFLANPYDFILLDLGLPDADGLDVLKEARKENPETAFIILTARGSTEDKISGLDLGADDYLSKPFSLPELYARMQAVTRRKFGLKSNLISLHDLQIDTSNHKLLYNEQEIVLTKKEYDLLTYLVLNKNRVLTRLQLSEHIWGNILEDDYDSNYIDVHIKNLRKKISQYTTTEWLETVRGLGYRVNWRK